MKIDTMKAREKRFLTPILNFFRDMKEATPIKQNYTTMEKAEAENKKRFGILHHLASGVITAAASGACPTQSALIAVKKRTAGTAHWCSR